jgi:hypothetical protein
LAANTNDDCAACCASSQNEYAESKKSICIESVMQNLSKVSLDTPEVPARSRLNEIGLMPGIHGLSS